MRARKDGSPEVTDGPFAEAKEFLAGYWIVDCETPQRAYEIAARASAAPGKGGAPLNMAIEVREVMSAPPVDGLLTTPIDLQRARLCCASWRRRFSARWSAASATSAAAEDAVQEALLAAAMQWPDEGVPDNPRGWLIHVAAPAHDRSPAQRARPPASRNDRGHSRRRPTSRSSPAPDGDTVGADRGRHADPAVHVLSPRADASVGDRADAAGRRRPDDGRDRQRVPGARGDHGAAHQPREADASRRRACPSGCRRIGERADALGAVLHVLYLIFNEGYASSSGPDLQRVDLSNEAIRLTRAVHHLLPGRRARSRDCSR